MSKGAALTMTLSVATDYVKKGIRCNCVCPGRVHTPFVDGYLAKNYPGKEKEKYRELAEYQPIGRMGKPEVKDRRHRRRRHMAPTRRIGVTHPT